MRLLSRTAVISKQRETAWSIGNELGQILTTKDRWVISNNGRNDCNDLAPCDHEEADTTLILHAHWRSKMWIWQFKQSLRTVDTDVVIAVAAFHQIELSELWIAFGNGKRFRYLPTLTVHNISRSIGKVKSQERLAFHAFTGCEQTSFFTTRSKKTAWDVWEAFNEVTTCLQGLTYVTTLEEIRETMPNLERYVTILYDGTSTCVAVNTSRKKSI